METERCRAGERKGNREDDWKRECCTRDGRERDGARRGNARSITRRAFTIKSTAQQRVTRAAIIIVSVAAAVAVGNLVGGADWNCALHSHCHRLWLAG